MADPADIVHSTAQSGLLDPLLAFGDKNLSLEEIKRRRAIAAALASRRRDFPKTVGEGMTYFGESLADAFETIQLGKAEKAYTAKRDADDPSLVRPAAAPDVVPPPPPPPPPASVAPRAAVPSPAAPAPVGRMANADPLTWEPTSGPASRAAMAQTLERLGANRMSAEVPSGPPPQYGGGAPVMAMGGGGDTVTDEGPNPPTIVNDIRPMVMAQAAPRPGTVPGAGAPTGLRPPNPDALRTVTPAHPQMGPLTKEELEARDYVRKYPGDKTAEERAAAHANIGRMRRENAYKEAQEEWKLRFGSGLKREEEEQKYEREYPSLQQKFEEEQRRIAMEKRLGGRKVEDFVKDFRKEHGEAEKQIGALNSINEAEAAIKSGAITGLGRNFRLDTARAKALFGSDRDDHIAAQSQVLESTLKGTIAVALAKFQAGDSRVTEGDLAAAQGITGTPNMQRAAILKLTAIAKQDTYDRVNAFEERRHQKVGGTELEGDFALTMRPVASPDKLKILHDNRSDPSIIAHFDNFYGPGSAKLELDRLRRTEEAKRR